MFPWEFIAFAMRMRSTPRLHPPKQTRLWPTSPASLTLTFRELSVPHSDGRAAAMHRRRFAQLPSVESRYRSNHGRHERVVSACCGAAGYSLIERTTERQLLPKPWGCASLATLLGIDPTDYVGKSQMIRLPAYT